jgi:ribonuclease-3
MDELLGYAFKNPLLLKMALTHRSADGENNERLEFLGDAILGVIVSSLLYHQFPKAPEGDLSRMRAHLVNEESLADIAKQLHVGDHILLGSGELKSGGFRRKSILADTLEAIIGAMYLDGGIEICEKKVHLWFKDCLSYLDSAVFLKDPKTRLQEYLQAQKQALPVYSVIAMMGQSHRQHFHVKCEIPGIDYRAEGVGSSRRAAEQMAAEKWIAWFLKEKR